MTGKVTLIGAGPGDAGLLTIKGQKALLEAEVVVYDRLVGEDVLSLIPKNAEMIDVGKESSNHKVSQERINEILAEKALEGKNTVRLKGGDCFLFGRGGEELELLAEKNIPFEVIPGITSALSVPAYAGIPVTHRDFVSSVHIITGHQKKNEPIKIDFESCVKCGGTLVFLMGVANMPQIMEGLMEYGMNPDMPCAVIENGTRPEQRKVTATIGTIVDKAEKAEIKSPAIIIVGEVCTLNERFDWFTNLPLKGRKVIVTRPKERQGTVSEKLSALGASVVQCPCIKTVSLVDNEMMLKILQEIGSHDWIVFTSPAGVKAVFDKFRESRLDARALSGRKIAVIGKATGEELEQYGIYADLMPETYTGKNLGEMLAEKAEPNEKVLLLRAVKGAPEITAELEKAGLSYNDLGVYETVYSLNEEDGEKITSLVNSSQIDYVTFTSASTVIAFSAVTDCTTGRFTAVCIGEKTRQCAEKHGMKTITAGEATVDSLVQCIVDDAGKRGN
ncbi:uroporphyrinogen III methyltransferase / synthase [Lachnospiraceae bacterium]|nr:uroporphyrinogen III methyltransferase / synthase [Lachnospiraceae bacterium]